MIVTGWTNWDNCKYIELSDNYFPEDVELFKEYFHNARVAVMEELKKYNYHICGGYHQNGKYGVPILDSKFAFKISLKEWGKLMAEAYPEEDYHDCDTHRYLKWGWISNHDQLLPHEKI